MKVTGDRGLQKAVWDSFRYLAPFPGGLESSLRARGGPFFFGVRNGSRLMSKLREAELVSFGCVLAKAELGEYRSGATQQW